MENKVNEVIDAVCDWIQKELKRTTERTGETIVLPVAPVSEVIKALAELVTARAEMEKNKEYHSLSKE